MNPRLHWFASHWRQTLGLTGVIGLLTLLMASVWLVPLYQQQQQLLTELTSVRHNHPNATATVQPSSLTAFYRQFPAFSSAPDWLDHIQHQLQRHQLTVKHVEYKLSREANTPLLRYQIQLPVSGDYLAIRRFVQELTHELPFVIVDDLEFSRDSASQSQVDALIRLTLLFGEPS